ncbi:phenylalanine--tRNA ligase alpha subunit [Daktulosphaira vitifoliae]|uniref:phenylalanine--tRNA ligase alpha subunit n=1 Tax=Daktulosphaira vitifoliae TaxID=58002 RepID=UPI0021AA9932|nr:phenylalanine--tRNA ligase alpha subunit [Daktulosphaira vitifoliae]XP_050542589.1 phenylalanine--tRNA ligase alpha subunit [Daktulosphaira vitifoliae]
MDSEELLNQLNVKNRTNTLDLAVENKIDHQKVIGIVNSILALNSNIITAVPVTNKCWELTSEGESILLNGSYEANVFKYIPPDGIPQKDLMSLPHAKIGFSQAMSKGWISIDRSINKVVRKTSSIIDQVKDDLAKLKISSDEIADSAKQDYKKRKLIREVIIKSFDLKKGPEFTTTITKLETELTPDMIQSGSWKTTQFKSYNFEALGQTLDFGCLHPLLKVRADIRQIFLEMGFTEMPTNNFVESSFWNFDSLFQPQQHPARDSHDTFFLDEPKSSENFPNCYLNKVKDVHSKGGYGSQGYGYNWSIEEAKKNVLRTHTTAVSARMLYSLANNFKPSKYFSIDRVFRNETLDATHLAEFHQVEGVIADYNLTLGDLIGILYMFFERLGMTELKFKPAYNPYTEPSMEIFCYHKGLGKWIEIGNSGMFRPEMLLPMGLPEKVNVIAWGLSLERPTMIKYGINNIRDLVGPKVNLQMVQINPICRLDK